MVTPIWSVSRSGILGLYSLSGRTSYRRIWWSLEASRFGFRLFKSKLDRQITTLPSDTIIIIQNLAAPTLHEIWRQDALLLSETRSWCPINGVLVRLQAMMTSSNRNIFRVTGLLCGEFTGHRWFPTQRTVTRSFNVFLWSAPEPTVGQTMQMVVIWDANAPIMSSM